MNSPGMDTAQQRIDALKQSAEAGVADAQFQLGLALETGDGIPQSDTMAALWFKRAAQQDHPEALNKYGDCLYYGRGTKQDKQRAFAQYLRGANLGNLECQYAAGYAYDNGDGVEQDDSLAFYWYKRAADLGEDKSQNSLGSLYAFGKGVEKNLALAEELYRKSIAQGNAYAMANLGALYRDEEQLRDPLEAIYWYRKGAELGNTICQNALGSMLALDDDLDNDYKEASIWLRKAALQGDTSAYGNLVHSLAQSKGDDEEIIYWAARCFEDGTANPPAYAAECYNRASHYELAAFFAEIAHSRGDKLSFDLKEELAQKHKATAETAKEYITSLGFDPEQVETGVIVFPLAPHEPPYKWDNVPVPSLVQQEMALLDNYSEPVPPAQTDNMVQSPAATPTPPANKQAASQRPAIAEELDTKPSEPGVRLPQMDPTQLPPGSILAEKYLIEKTLGKGGMAIVFKAKHLLMNRPVAIKMMLPEVARDQVTVRRFQREAENASMLRHPNVITIYDFGVSPEGAPFMVMDYLEGESLEAILEQEKMMSPQRAVPILVQISDALGAAHQQSIIHRDVKPSNVMIENTSTHKDFVRLVDFGIAKALDEQDVQKQKLTKTGEVFGSLVYMSPEQCMGRPLDQRSDIYSFGCVIFELFSGEPPFLGDTVFETMSKHIYEAPPSLTQVIPHIPQAAALEKIFFKCVEKEPEKRYQNMNEVREDLLSIRL